MDITILTVILLLLGASTCRCELLVESPSNYTKSMDRLSETMVNIMTTCFRGKGVGLAGRLPGTIYRTLSVVHSIPLVLIQNYWKWGSNATQSKKYKSPLGVFIIEAADPDVYCDLIQINIQGFKYWNLTAPFFILDLSRGCKSMDNLLYGAMRYRMLHATVLCRDHKSGRIMFTSNIYTSNAPAVWRKEHADYNADEKTFLTIFRYEYGEKEVFSCDDLVFDKLADLGGHSVGLKDQPDQYARRTMITKGRSAKAFENTRRRILNIVFRTINATLEVLNETYWNWVGINTEPHWLQYSWTTKRGLTYPHKQVEANIITQFRGAKSQLVKILSIIDRDSYFGMAVVYLVTLIFLTTFLGQPLVRALLNVVRITCNTGLVNLRDDTASRIYLGCLLFFVVTMQGIFQGDLASRLTKYIPLRNVENVQDLRDLGYTKIYGKEYYRAIFVGTELEGRFVASDDEPECIMHVKNDSSVAYVGRSESFIIDMVEEYNLHISRKPVEMMYVGFDILWDWEIEARINTMLSRMVEADILESWDVRCKPIQLSDFYVDPMVKTNVDFKVLELHELLFAFAILGIGLAWSIVVFVIELALGYRWTCDITIWRHGDARRESVVEILA